MTADPTPPAVAAAWTCRTPTDRPATPVLRPRLSGSHRGAREPPARPGRRTAWKHSPPAATSPRPEVGVEVRLPLDHPLLPDQHVVAHLEEHRHDRREIRGHDHQRRVYLLVIR